MSFWVDRSWEVLDGGGGGVCRLERRLDEHHGDVVAVLEKDVGELCHGANVTDASAGVQDHGLPHLEPMEGGWTDCFFENLLEVALAGGNTP